MGCLEGIEVGARVEWNGAPVGKVVHLGYYDRSQKADIALANGYLGKLHSDARIRVVQTESAVIRIIGGDDANYKILEPGGRIPLQSTGDEGKWAGACLRGWLHDIAGEFSELWQSITDKKFLRDLEARDKIARNEGAMSTY